MTAIPLGGFCPSARKLLSRYGKAGYVGEPLISAAHLAMSCTLMTITERKITKNMGLRILLRSGKSLVVTDLGNEKASQ